jgi:hypothetical protein
VRKPLLPVVAVLVLFIAAGPVILDSCVISCQARQDANTGAGGSGHCHEAASSDAASVWQATGSCSHDHIALSAESAFQARSESSLSVAHAAVIGGVAAAPLDRGCGQAMVSSPSPHRWCAPAFAIPLRV